MCGHKAFSQSNLTEHCKSKHQGKMYSCISCNKQFKSAGSLNNHTKSVHEGIRYNCNICQYSATRRINLKHVNALHLPV